MRISSFSRASSCRSRPFSALSRTLVFQLLTAQLRVEVKEKFFHAAAAVHGSVYFKVLDDAAFFAVGSVVDDVLVLTASFNLYLTRPVSSGVIQASGRVVHRSRRLFVAEAVASDSEGRELARGSGTFMRSQIALAAEMGYR